MKAKELAALLLQHPELEVYVRGYEMGANAAQFILLTHVQPNPKWEGQMYYGTHLVEGEYPFDSQRGQQAALFIGAERIIGQGYEEIQGREL